MTANQFWELQQFSYFETYSFNRGPERTALIQRTKEELQTARYMRQPALRQLLASLEQATGTLTQGLQSLHPTAVKVTTVSQDSERARQLADIFWQAKAQEAYAMCWPIYRDAIAFYDAQGRLLRVLNICFECLYMQVDNGVYVEADLATYEALHIYFEKLGHPIEQGSTN